MDNLSEMLKGILEGIVLEIISRGEIYGYEITKKLHALGFQGIAEATVYALLLRLEKTSSSTLRKNRQTWGRQENFIR
ncbi:Transcriptional regulator PadR-like family protein [Anoxybacillus sp. BCO1]|nr:Transcriptional regulator PadR-like family protein [Anoxybacillus sp. BCO1]